MGIQPVTRGIQEGYSAVTLADASTTCGGLQTGYRRDTTGLQQGSRVTGGSQPVTQGYRLTNPCNPPRICHPRRPRDARGFQGHRRLYPSPPGLQRVSRRLFLGHRQVTRRLQGYRRLSPCHPPVTLGYRVVTRGSGSMRFPGDIYSTSSVYI